MLVGVAAGAVVVFGAAPDDEAAGAIVLAGCGAAEPAAGFELPVVVPPVDGVVDVAGAVGNVVIGVGSRGNGLEVTLAIRSVRPPSDPLCLYLYQVVRLSSQSFLPVYFGSLPAKETARA